MPKKCIYFNINTLCTLTLKGENKKWKDFHIQQMFKSSLPRLVTKNASIVIIFGDMTPS